MTAGVARNEARVSVAPGPLVGPVLSRVVGMLAARAHCPVDRLDDALLIADAIAAAAPEHSGDKRLVVDVVAVDAGLEIAVRELAQGGGDALMASAALPGVGNVLERIASDVRVENDDHGPESLVVRLDFEA